MTAASRRPSGHITLLVAVALVVAACGATIPPIESSNPTPTRPPVTPAPSTGKFVASAYPVKGSAPCGEKAPPDPSHGAYTGNLKRIHAEDATTVVFELCAPDVAFLSKIADPAFGINDAAWLKGAHRRHGLRAGGDHDRRQRDRTLPARGVGPGQPGQPRPQ